MVKKISKRKTVLFSGVLFMALVSLLAFSCKGLEDLAKDVGLEKVNYYTVTFDANGGNLSGVSFITVEEGKLARPSEASKNGVTTTKWTKVKDDATIWDFEKDKVTETMTLYAKW